jgi:hypothetical protein
MAVVQDDVWILANLKETQLERVRVGQPVEIKIDALPHYRFTGRFNLRLGEERACVLILIWSHRRIVTWSTAIAKAPVLA